MDKQEIDDASERYQNAIRRFTRPWSGRRGIESIDRNAGVILVKVPLNQLSDILATRAIESQRDVLGSEIDASSCFAFAYQLVGQDWSIMVSEVTNYLEERSELSAAEISQALEWTVIYLYVSDSVGSIGYEIYESGELAEYFYGQDCGEIDEDYELVIEDYELVIDRGNGNETKAPTPQGYLLTPYPDDPKYAQEAHFWSSRRQVTAEQIGSVFDFARQLLVDYETYDPALDPSYFLGSYPRCGHRYIVKNRGVCLSLGYDQNGQSQTVTSIPDLIRVDYFRFGN
jgi:hypothetical protein